MHHLALLQHEYYGNPVSAYLFAAAAFLAFVWGFLAVRRLSRAKGDSLAARLTGQVHAPELLIVALYLSLRSVDLPHRFETGLHAVAVVAIAWRAIGLLSTAAGYAITRMIVAERDDAANRETAQAATLAAKVLIWIGALVFVLGNLGFNVSSMLAGLGIGGVAVALAAQAVLGDLFSAVAIYLDKPFVVGDAIQVGDATGTVEHIGIKTTRVRALSGEMLVFANSTLTSTRLQNYRLMGERRVAFRFSVPPDLPTQTLKRIPAQVQAIVSALPDVRFERAHLAQYQDSGLQYEVVYFVRTPDYGVYMDRQQAVLIGLLEALRADGIALAQPTLSVAVAGGKPA